MIKINRKNMRIKNSRKNNNNGGNRDRRYDPSRQLGTKMNIFNKIDAATVNINVPVIIYSNAVTNNYSFANGTDVRFFLFNSISIASGEFGRYEAIFSEYRISKVSALLARVTNTITTSLVEALTSLYIGIDPEIISSVVANPANATLLQSDNAKFIPSTILDAKVISFTFPGVGQNTHQWIPVNQVTAGAFYIGTNTGNMPSTNIIVFDGFLSLTVDFRGSLTH
jgi:hypothetical protein